jgi:hypothetical protein
MGSSVSVSNSNFYSKQNNELFELNCTYTCNDNKLFINIIPSDPEPNSESNPESLKPYNINKVLGGKYLGSDLIIVVDIDNKSRPNELNDTVKHAIKTMITSLDSLDRLALIMPNTKSNLMQMTSQNKNTVLDILFQPNIFKSTNTSYGLKTAINMVDSNNIRNTAILLLTDGYPSVIDHLVDRDGYPTVSKHRSLALYELKYINLIDSVLDTKLKNCSIHTFGYGPYGAFGNAVNSNLLTKIATKGKGTYNFISCYSTKDMVKTIFVNWLCNFLTTVAYNVKFIFSYFECEKIFDIGHICFGQTRTIVIPNIYFSHITNAKIKYTSPFMGQEIINTDPQIINFNLDKMNQHIIRSKIPELFDKAIAGANGGGFNIAKITINNLITEIDTYHKFTYSDSYLCGLQEDLEGQVMLAFHGDNYDIWGKYYIETFIFAHLGQYCNGKDPGVQLFGGTLFKFLRNHIETIFDDMDFVSSKVYIPKLSFSLLD